MTPQLLAVSSVCFLTEFPWTSPCSREGTQGLSSLSQGSKGSVARGAGTFWGPLPQKEFPPSPGMRSVITAPGREMSCPAVSTVHFCGLWTEAVAARSGAMGFVNMWVQPEPRSVFPPSYSDPVQPRRGKEGREDLSVHAPEAAAHLVRPPRTCGAAVTAPVFPSERKVTDFHQDRQNKAGG